MEYITVWTNDLSSDKQAQEKAREALNAGNAVHIDSTCIGHTRAEMVKHQGSVFLRCEGAHEVEAPKNERWLGAFFAK